MVSEGASLPHYNTKGHCNYYSPHTQGRPLYTTVPPTSQHPQQSQCPNNDSHPATTVPPHSLPSLHSPISSRAEAGLSLRVLSRVSHSTDDATPPAWQGTAEVADPDHNNKQVTTHLSISKDCCSLCRSPAPSVGKGDTGMAARRKTNSECGPPQSHPDHSHFPPSATRPGHQQAARTCGSVCHMAGPGLVSW